jgi:hypothetical protein
LKKCVLHDSAGSRMIAHIRAGQAEEDSPPVVVPDVARCRLLAWLG